MATAQLVSTGIGLRHVRVALRDDDGVIAVPAAQSMGVAYRGLHVTGATALTVTIPDPQRVPARGDDRTYHTFQLPPTDSPSGELRVSKTNLDVIAMLTATERFGSPPMRKIGLGTDAQGEEPALVLWGSREAIDSEEGSASFGTQIWQTYIFLHALASVRPATMEDSAVGEVIYAVAGNDGTVDELGSAFSSAVHGFTKGPLIIIQSRYKFMLDAFVGDAVYKSFALSETPVSGGVLNVAVEGTVQELTTDYTVASNIVTFVSAPGDGEKIIVEYEYS